MVQTRRGGTHPERDGERAQETSAERLRSSGERLRVLVIDDEPLVLKTFTRLFGRQYAITALGSAADALELFTRGERFDVVLCDLMMPEMSGMDLYKALQELDPRIAERVVFVTGGAFGPGIQEFLGGVPNHRIYKPWKPEELRAIVERVAGR